MELTPEQCEMLSLYVDTNSINVDAIKNYLKRHRLVKPDIFTKCGLKDLPLHNDYQEAVECGFSPILSHNFDPIDRKTFIRRIPFYFYRRKSTKSGLLIKYLPDPDERKKDPGALEETYRTLEWLFYELKIPIEAIFDYPYQQIWASPNWSGINKPPYYVSFKRDVRISSRQIFLLWCKYIRRCVKLGWLDYFPKHLLAAANYAAEALGEDPIIYEPFVYLNDPVSRDGLTFTCAGHFPCDENGIPIMRWTSIGVRNPKSIHFNAVNSCFGTLTIEANPDSTLWLYHSPEDDDFDDAGWECIFIGPLAMEFDPESLKSYRVSYGLTQKEFATTIGANLRTYQKWEGGQSIPDGLFLMRILNLLEIDEQSLCKIPEIPHEIL